jgi:Uma2 family endonuclease
MIESLIASEREVEAGGLCQYTGPAWPAHNAASKSKSRRCDGGRPPDADAMADAQRHDALTEAQYLRLEEAAAVRHEYVAGEIHAMAGASERHNRITLNIAFHLRAAARGSACRAFMADMKLRIEPPVTFYYPDVMLVCDPADDHPLYKQAPCFIAEVLSPATAAVDLREKWAVYKALPSLRYYLLVDSERLWAKVYFRGDDAAWYEQELGERDQLEVACAGTRVRLTLDDLYEDTGLLRV